MAGRPLIEHTIDRLRLAGCADVVVVTGHLGHLIDLDGIVRVENPDYPDNNILHSFVYAGNHLAGRALSRLCPAGTGAAAAGHGVVERRG